MHYLQACLFKYITVAAFYFYAQCGEDAAKRGGWNSHGNYIVDHGKSWKNHGIVFLHFCGNPVSGMWLCVVFVLSSPQLLPLKLHNL